MDYMGKGVINLADAHDVNSVGGKAAALAKLIKAGFNAPTGFVVTTSVSIDDGQTEIFKQFESLGAAKVAVRSSAANEDGKQAAWAGQFDTFLNIGRDELLKKIEACRKSGESERAKSYSRQKHVSGGPVAVIVQTMVPSQVAGVAFSAHPVTGDLTKIVIESAPGLGEKVVSGSVDPDNFIIDKASGEVIEKHPDQASTLTSIQSKSLSAQVSKIEELFGYPVDVEWAIANGRIYILQARPITTLN